MDFLNDWAYGLAFCSHECDKCLLGIFKDNGHKCSNNAKELLNAINLYNSNNKKEKKKEGGKS